MFFKCEDCGKRFFFPKGQKACEIRHMFATHPVPTKSVSQRPTAKRESSGKSYFVDNDVNFMFHALGLEHRIPDDTIDPRPYHSDTSSGDCIRVEHVPQESVMRLHARDNDPSPTPDNYESSSSSDGGCSGGD